MSQDTFISAIIQALRNNSQYRELRPSRGVFQADVYLLNIDDQYVVVKDFSRRFWWSRAWVCRLLIKREINVLQQFGSSGFVPRFYGRVSADIFAMEFLEGEHPGKENAGQWPDSYASAKEFLELFHREGYVHNDFRRSNVLVQPDGTVKFFDFASAIRKPRRCQKLLFPWVWLLGIMQTADTTSLLKMKPDFTGEPLTREERGQLKKKPAWIRAIRYIWSNGINKPILRRFK